MERADEVLQARSRPPQLPPEVLRELGQRELAAFARRLSPQNLQTIEAMHARYGWPGVRLGLENAGLSPAALEAATETARVGGLPALVQAVTERIQHEDMAQLQAQAAPAAAGLLSQMDPAVAARLMAEGGPGRFVQAAVAEGVDPAAAVVAARTLEAQGVEGARALAVQHIEHAQRQAEVRANVERATSEAQKDAAWSPLAAGLSDPAFHESVAAWYAQHGAQLEAHGVGIRKGESPGEWFVRTARHLGPEAGIINDNPTHLFAAKHDGIAALAEITGEAPEVIRATLRQVAELNDHHELRESLRASGEAERKARAVSIGPDRKAVETQPRKPDGVRTAIEKAAAKLGIRGDDEETFHADSALEAKMALDSGTPLDRLKLSSNAQAQIARRAERNNQVKADHAKSIRGRIEQAAEHLEGRAAPTTAPERPQESGGMSIDQAMQAADHHLNGGSTDDDE
ncbi:hypothetical protein [Anaeromyxobacter dehalogenans]|uniref:hypothetical protein n=1 Tax=Anaeromyxobacter dehalogenans TaxID=161493 RepID=UPI0012EDFD3F|nr:hypothetical protein [Anaeromyxobacter dehalogenans]